MSSKTLVLQVLSVSLLAVLLIGCSSGPTVTSSPDLIDPSRTSRESGSTDDIYDAVSQAINSMMASERVLNQAGNRVVLNEIENNTGISGYDERVVYNRFMSNLINYGGDKLVFLSRESVAAERAKQLSGEVKTSGVEKAPAGADMALDIQLLQIPGTKTQTIQYTFRLTNLDGIIVWTYSCEIKKKR